MKPSESESEKTMGELIRDAREARGLTRKELADVLSLSDQYVYQVETGRRMPTLETVWAFAGALGIDPQSLDFRLASVKKRKGPDA